MPYLKSFKERGFIHLKGRIWTKPSNVIDEGRYGVWGVGGVLETLRFAVQHTNIVCYPIKKQ